MFKIFIGIIAVVLCTFGGYKISVKYAKRREFFSYWEAFNLKMKTETSFTHGSVKQVCVSAKDDDRFIQSAKYYYLENKEPVFPTCITSEEKEIINSYIKQVGTSDAESQLKFLQRMDVQISEYLKKSREEEKKYRALYVKLGFLTGLIIFVLLL